MQSSHRHDLGYAWSQDIASVTMPPAPKPIGIFDQYIAARTETIVLKEKILSLSGDSFDIKLATGQPLIRVDGQVFSLRGRKKVYDMSGRYLFDIYKELMHLIHTTYVVEDVERNVRLMEIRNAFKDRKMLNVREWLGGQQTYALVVAPGVDMALMCALCICLDEKNNDD